MKTLLVLLLLLSPCFVAYSVYEAQQLAQERYPSLPRSWTSSAADADVPIELDPIRHRQREARAEQGQRRKYQEEERFEAAGREHERAVEAHHVRIRCVSWGFFGFALVAMGSLFHEMRRRRVRILAAAGAGTAVVFGVWSSLLSGHVSFEEVALAWIGAAVLLGGLTAIALAWLPRVSVQPIAPRSWSAA